MLIFTLFWNTALECLLNIDFVRYQAPLAKFCTG